MPMIIREARLDLMHFPHFNVPVLNPTPFVVTIHDLTHTLRRSLGSTTRDPATFRIKTAGYELALRRAVSGSRKVIAVSEATKHSIIRYLGTKPAKIAVTYEGVDSESFAQPDRAVRDKLGLQYPYFLYIGAAYPHKNLYKLLEAFGLLVHRGEKKYQLVLAGDHDVFGPPLQKRAKELGLEKLVVFPGRVTDSEIAGLLEGALAFCFVSLSEGFGLPGLEAMAQGVPVLSSNLTSLPEVYEEAAYYVEAEDPDAVAAGLEKLATDSKLRKELGAKGRKQALKYSWAEMAEQTLEVYRAAIGHKP